MKRLWTVLAVAIGAGSGAAAAEVGPCNALDSISSQRAAKGDKSALGFSNLDVGRVGASYHPQRGLLLTVPYTLYNPDDKRGRAGSVAVRIDLRGSGAVAIER